MRANVHIRFPQGAFARLHQRLLQDTQREAFALLLGQSHRFEDYTVIKVVEMDIARPEDYTSQGIAHLRLKREYIYDRLVKMQRQGHADTLIDVHTHPFCTQGAAFSGVDDRDERVFHQWLGDTLDNVHYASIVLSQTDYAARLWERRQNRLFAIPAQIKTQTVAEAWPCAQQPPDKRPCEQNTFARATDAQQGFLARSVLALGLENLRRMTNDQRIAVVGVGGLGSIIAEHLVHSGFMHLDLIDHDVLEITNLNRIVGAYYRDAKAARLKVKTVQQHLQRINPFATIHAHPQRIEEDSLLPVLARADWIILATDDHASRFKTQEIALRFGIPLLSAGVNITVEAGQISDMSGEVIIARQGDRLCLNCLGRISTTRLAAQAFPDLGKTLAARGYVSGAEVKEPAVKTLNALLATLSVDLLINQYTERQPHVPVWVYENNLAPCIYPDTDSVAQRRKDCFYCHDTCSDTAAVSH